MASTVTVLYGILVRALHTKGTRNLTLASHRHHQPKHPRPPGNSFGELLELKLVWLAPVCLLALHKEQSFLLQRRGSISGQAPSTDSEQSPPLIRPSWQMRLTSKTPARCREEKYGRRIASLPWTFERTLTIDSPVRHTKHLTSSGYSLIAPTVGEVGAAHRPSFFPSLHSTRLLRSTEVLH